MGQNVKIKTSLTKQEAKELKWLLGTEESRQEKVDGFVSEDLKGLVAKLKPLLKEV